MKNKPIIKVASRAVLMAIAIASVILSFAMPNKTSAGDSISPFLFYTNWSVYLATVSSALVLCLAVLEMVSGKEKRILAVDMIEFAAVIMIIATFIVSAFVLPDKIWTAGYWTVTSIFKHFLLPILVVAEFILFTPKGSAKIYFPFTSLVAPLAYWVILIVRFVIYRNACGGAIPEAEQPHYYPYGFTNLDTGHSLGGLIGLLAGIMVGLILIGFGLYFLKKEKRQSL